MTEEGGIARPWKGQPQHGSWDAGEKVLEEVTLTLGSGGGVGSTWAKRDRKERHPGH